MKYLVNDTDLTAIADAIRDRRGVTSKIAFEDLPSAIMTYLVKKTLFTGLCARSLETIDDVDGFVSRIGKYAFYQYTTLEVANFPNAITVNPYGFRHCTALTDLELPRCTTIKEYGIANCTSLKGLHLPRVTSIGANAFSGCSVLGSIRLGGTSVATLSSTSAFNGTPFASGGDGGTIYVPASLEGGYRAGTNWSSLLTANSNNQLKTY